MDDREPLEPIDWPFGQSIPAQAADRRVLCLPWGTQPLKTGISFSSKLIAQPEGPFLARTPFNQQELAQASLEYKPASSGYFEEHTSSFNSNSFEHLGVGFGVSIGGSFLGGGVSGQYDKTLMENKDAYKTSQIASTRRGSLQLAKDPVLSDEAVNLLVEKGIPGFRAAYGDYYVAGFNLGADSGVCISFSQNDRSESESYSITVTVKFLFFSASHTWSHEETETMQKIQITVNGFDTLAGKKTDVSSEGPGGLVSLRAEAAALVARNRSIAADVEERLRGLGLGLEGRVITGRDLDRIRAVGLVVEVILFPYMGLSQVASHQPPHD